MTNLMARIRGRLHRRVRMLLPARLLRCIWWLKSGAWGGIFSVVPVSHLKVVACAFYGASYGGGPKYVIDELLQRSQGLDIVWLLRADESPTNLPKGVRSVRYGSIQSLFELATAGVWIDDSRKTFVPPKRRNQFYIQMWHGPLAIKKIEGDASEYLNDSYLYYALRDARNTDLMLSGSDWFTALIRQAFWYDGEVMMGGNPRLDRLFLEEADLPAKVKRSIGVAESQRILLYAPTFRNREFRYASETELRRFARAARARWGGDWVVLRRLHPNVRMAQPVGPVGLDVGAYPDVQELLKATDLLITDYSSVFFDSALAGQKCVLFTPDLDDYLKFERPVYFMPSQLPFNSAATADGLVAAIEGFDEEEYRERVRLFLDRLGVFEDGRASSRVAERILAEVDGPANRRAMPHPTKTGVRSLSSRTPRPAGSGKATLRRSAGRSR